MASLRAYLHAIWKLDRCGLFLHQVVRENGTYAAAMTDDNGNGYVQFAKDDLQKVRECTVQFSEVMTNLKCGEISELIANGKTCDAGCVQKP